MADTQDEERHLDEIIIDQQFCGPPGSGNGGYVCGRLAGYIDGPATVRLIKPPPLDTPLAVTRADGEILLSQGEGLIARAWAGAPEMEVPAPPDLVSARDRTGLFAGHRHHAFPGCFVCGTHRTLGDGLMIYAGPPREARQAPAGVSNHVACTWTPHSSFCGDNGELLPEFCWAALDCPSGWSFLSSGEEVALLGQFSAQIRSRLESGKEYIVAGWEFSRNGRKRLTGSAIYSSGGEPLARALATWITIDPPG